MTRQADIAGVIFSDGAATITLAPPDNTTGWTVWYRMCKHPQGGDVLGRAPAELSGYPSPNLVNKWAGSGYTSNESGIRALDDSRGVWRVDLPKGETSGLEQGAYFYEFWRMDSGYQKKLVEGFRLLG